MDDGSRKIKENFRLIQSYCARFVRKINDCAIGPEDLWQEGAIAYWQGEDKYDPDLGVKYSTYIRPRVMRDVRNFFYRFNRGFTLGIGTANNVSLFLYAKRRLYKILGREPTNEEVGERLAWGKERIDRTVAALEIVFISSSLPLSRVVSGDSEKGRKLEEVLVFDQGLTAEKKTINLELARRLDDILGDLPPNKRRALIESIASEESLLKLGKDLGVSGERVRVLVKGAIFEIRNSPKLKELVEFNGQIECFGILFNIEGEAGLEQVKREQIRRILADNNSWPDFYSHKNDQGKLKCLRLYFGLEGKFHTLEEVGKKLYKQRQRLNALELLQDALEKLPSPLKKRIVAAIKEGEGW